MRDVWCSVDDLEDGDIVLGYSRDGVYAAWQGPLHVRYTMLGKRWMDDQGRDQGRIQRTLLIGCSMRVLRP